MTWADIAAGRKPTAAPATSVRDSPRIAIAAPVSREIPSTLSNTTAGLASMSIATPVQPRSTPSVVTPKLDTTQNNARKGTNRRHRGGKKKDIDSSKGQVVRVSQAATGVPLEKFRLFPKLPAELRLKIYRHAMVQRRLIELEWGPNMSIPPGLGNGSHHWVRVCPRSRKPPVLMHVCRESRDEAQKAYQLRCFDSQLSQYLPNMPELHEHYIWYNPKTDVIFFGEDTCVSTYISVFSSKVEDIPAIAILSTNKNEACCSHDDPAYDVDGGVDTLQALHGFDPKPCTLHDYRYGGCPGLKEVLVVVKSKLWPKKQGEVDSFVTLRPATNEGLTKGQVRFKARLERDISKVEAGFPLPRVGGNIWVDDDKPIFNFVSFAPVPWGVDPRDPDGITISRKDLGKLRRGDWAFVKHTEAVTGCELIIPDEEYRGEDPREIGFRGVRKSIDAAKKAIEERLAALNA